MMHNLFFQFNPKIRSSQTYFKEILIIIYFIKGEMPFFLSQDNLWWNFLFQPSLRAHPPYIPYLVSFSLTFPFFM